MTQSTNVRPVLVVDFGAQYAQLIARRVREASVYSEIVHHNVTAAEVAAKNPLAIILSGGPSSVYEAGSPQLDPAILELGVPVLGICYGFQTLANTLGGTFNARLTGATTLTAPTTVNTLTTSGTASVVSGLASSVFGKYGPSGELLSLTLANAAGFLVKDGTTTFDMGTLVGPSTGSAYFHVLPGATLAVVGYAMAGLNRSGVPEVFAIYVLHLVLRKLLAEGGLAAVEARNRRKAENLYGAIDGSGGFYRNEVQAAARSWMNVPFFLPDETREKAFLKEAEAAGLLGLKGHRAVGGMRASIYNAMPLEGVQALVAYMRDFEQKQA